MGEIILHWLAGFAGIGLIYCSLLLYENEETTIHNKLDDWWKLLDQKSKKAIKGHATIMQKLGLTIDTALNKIFGKEIWCWQNTLSTWCLSSLSINLLLACSVVFLSKNGINRDFFLSHNISQFLYVISFAILLLAPLTRDYKSKRKAWVCVVTIGVLVVTYRFLADTFEYNRAMAEAEAAGFRLDDYLFSHVTILILVQLVIMHFTPLFRVIFDLLVLRKTIKAHLKCVFIFLAMVGFISFTVINNFKQEKYDNGFTMFTFICPDPITLSVVYLGVYGLAWFAIALIFFPAGLAAYAPFVRLGVNKTSDLFS